MSYYSYCSNSKYSRRAIKRMIGFQIFCYRHKNKIKTEKFCKKCGITPSELEKLELGMAVRTTPNWTLIDKVFEAYHLQLKLSIQHKEV